MAKSRKRFKNRLHKGSFVQMRKDILRHPNYHSLSHKAARLLWDLWGQFNGNNNGDFCAAFSVMRDKGWTSKDQLYRAKKELIAKGFIVTTRYGGLNMGPHLYAVTWAPIHECKGKLDMDPTNTPLNCWREYGTN